jgi:hypothetical protein
MAVETHDAAGRIVDEKTAEAGEQISRNERSTGRTSARAQAPAQDIEDRNAERGAVQPETLADLKAASRDLKQRIDEEKRKHDMSINGSLGDPEVDARNADGRRDLPNEDDA